ncbi:MAG: glycosyltransferase family 4 protein [Paracoccaceae bacterium]
MTSTAAIYFHPDIIERPETPLVGRRAAGTSFLRGYIQHVQADVLHCVTDTQSAIEEFAGVCAQNNWHGDVVGHLQDDPDALANPGTLFVPGPSLATFAWSRRSRANSYSLCGITHTLSTKTIQTDLANLLYAPVEPFDAIICTSTAARHVVEHHLDVAEEYIRARFDARNVPRPLLPTIPLGVETSRFAPTPETRRSMRQRLNLSDEQIVLMTMGRLSVFEKMSPGPMFLALERAARSIRQRLVLLMVGWFKDETAEKQHKTMAAVMAPSVDVLFADGNDETLRTDIWAAADIFTLPVDNIQETFGLAPVEAMAAGLPVVCSDWNGFKDTVAHGETGFRVPTMAPSPENGTELAKRHGSGKDQYSQYLMAINQKTCIDLGAYADAIVKLATDASLRKNMGNAGRKRAIELFDWSVVVPQYQSLWAEQTEIRLRITPNEKDANPRNALSELDPFQTYAHYPTTTISPTTEIHAPIQVKNEEVHRLLILSGAHAYGSLIASSARLTSLQNVVHQHGALTLSALSDQCSAPISEIQGLVLWLAKYGLVTVNFGTVKTT